MMSCTDENSNFGRMSEAESLAYCERAFAGHLQGHNLLSNKSAWFRYTMVNNRHWYHGKVVLLGDALRTGRPSVGSGKARAYERLHPELGFTTG